MFEYLTYVLRARFVCVPVCVLHHGSASPLITVCKLRAKGFAGAQGGSLCSHM